MKNAFSLKVNLSILFLFLSIVLFGQEHSLNFQAKQGITGFRNQKGYNSYPPQKIIPGGDFSIGLDYQFSFFSKKIFIGSVGVLWNTSSFARRSITETNVVFIFNIPTIIPPKRDYTTHRFQSSSIMLPIKIKSQIKRIRLSLGLISRFHLSTKLYYEEIEEVISAPLNYESLAVTYMAGESISNSPFRNGHSERVFLKDKMDIQFLFGLDFFLNEKLSVGLEYRNLINDNYLTIRSEYQDQFGRWRMSIKDYEFSVATISIGINYKIF